MTIATHKVVQTRRFFLKASSLFVGALLLGGTTEFIGCGTASRLIAQRGEVFTPGAARVVLMSTSDDVITVDVFNQTAYPLVIYRDLFMLSTATGMRSRMKGGVSNVYTVRGGGVHTVKVRFDLTGMRPGEQAALVFQNALIVNGQPLPLEPLPFIVQ
jgi:hypothetical protein